ncbi:MAG TPA: flagellar hook-associated protein FlgL [Acidisarcina sp.]
MRVTTLVNDVLSGVQQSEQSLQIALEQLSSGKRVNQPSDDPSASAEMVQNLSQSANVDQYTKNVSSLLSETQTADSSLYSVVTLLTQAITVGTQGANGALTTANKQALATQVQAILGNVVSQANSSYRGSYLFGGTASSAAPYTAAVGAPSGYQYNGNSNVNTVQIGDSLSTPTNIPGNQIFSQPGSDVLAALSGLVSALQTGTTPQIVAATAAITTASTYVGQERVALGNISSQLTSQESYLSQETLTLATQQNSLVGIDVSIAATNLSEAEISHSAVLTAAAKVLPNTLLDYLK